MTEQLTQLSTDLTATVLRMRDVMREMLKKFPLDDADLNKDYIAAECIHHVDSVSAIPARLLRNHALADRTIRTPGYAHLYLSDGRLVSNDIKAFQQFIVYMDEVIEAKPEYTKPGGEILPEFSKLKSIANEAIKLCQEYLDKNPEPVKGGIGGVQ